MVLGSLVVALGIAESAAAALRDGAFPYLNIFQADADFGVRLRPDAQTAVRSFSGNVTSVHTSSLGFRGPEWVTGAATRVLLVGDSQMFGYNVDFDHTIAARLTHPERAVFNAAVPSWGPLEYTAIVRELAPRYRPTHLIFVANVANDWLESEAPNRLRTTEHDGWLVARHPDLQTPLDFPGRDFLMGRSHLVYAFRKVASHVGGNAPPRAANVDQLVQRLDELRASSTHRSRITRHLLAARDACGCTVIATALPLDVQVYAGEWAKYGTRPRNLRATEVLARDFLADAEEHGIDTLDLLPVLRAASPGAFLADDYHLSPTGHRAIATALEGHLP